MKPSNFSPARAHLERAMDHLSGDDDTSIEARNALGLLIDATVIAEHRGPKAKVIEFVARARRKA